MPPERTALLVLGMHRSGTSVATGLLQQLGADLPNRLLSRGPDNPTGFWEAPELVEIHDELLGSAGFAWADLVGPGRPWYADRPAQAAKARLLAFLEAAFEHSTVFAVKDPRICRFVPLWLEVLHAFGATPKAVLTLRNPLEVAASLRERNGHSVAAGTLLWLQHVLAAERDTRALLRAFVRYEDVLADWRASGARIARTLEIFATHEPRGDPAVFEGVVSDRLRHHTATVEELEGRADVADWVKQAYRALLELAEDPADARARSMIDTVAREFDRAAFAFAPLLGPAIEPPRARPPTPRRGPREESSLAPSPAPVLVTGAIRSGTTLVGRIVATARDTVYLHEPFNPDSPWSAAFPLPINFFHIADHNRGAYATRFARLLRLEPDVRGAWQAGERARRYRLLERTTGRGRDGARRVPVIKDPMALFSVEWLVSEFGMRPVVVVRDPFDVLSSLVRLRWAERMGLSWLHAQPALRTRLTEMSERLGIPLHAEAVPSDHTLGPAVQMLRICYLACLYYSAEAGYDTVSYEGLTRKPNEVVPRLLEALALESTAATAKALASGRRARLDFRRAHQTRLEPVDVDETRMRRRATEDALVDRGLVDRGFEDLRLRFPPGLAW